MTKRPVIIPVAGGKGGVGKSLVTANLAVALAHLGKRSIAIDLDLGGSNLHYFFGIPNKYPGVGDFLKARRGELTDFMVPLEDGRLQFIPGDGKTPFMANIAHVQKVKLINRMLKLEADYVLLDLGAGSTFNTLDFFGLSERGLMVTTPDYPAIISMLGFAKSHLLRQIERRLADNRSVSLLLKDIYENPMESQVPSIDVLRQRVATEDTAAAAVIDEIYSQFRPRVIFNRGSQPDDSRMAAQISHSMKEVLKIEADYFGFIFNDPAVDAAVRKRVSLMANFPDSSAARAIRRIAERIAKYWDHDIPNSADLIYQHAKAAFEDTRK